MWWKSEAARQQLIALYLVACQPSRQPENVLIKESVPTCLLGCIDQVMVAGTTVYVHTWWCMLWMSIDVLRRIDQPSLMHTALNRPS